MCRRPLAPVECLRCNRLLPLEDGARESEDPNLSPKPKKREKNGLLKPKLVPVPECGGEGDCVVDVAVYKLLSGDCSKTRHQ